MHPATHSRSTLYLSYMREMPCQAMILLNSLIRGLLSPTQDLLCRLCNPLTQLGINTLEKPCKKPTISLALAFQRSKTKPQKEKETVGPGYTKRRI
jgi:hypothetical protein